MDEERNVKFNCYQCPCGGREFQIGPGIIKCDNCGFALKFDQGPLWNFVHENRLDKNTNSNDVMVLPGPGRFNRLLKESDVKESFKEHMIRHPNKKLN